MVYVCSIKSELSIQVDIASKELADKSNYVVCVGNTLPETEFMNACRDVQRAHAAWEHAKHLLSTHELQHGC